MSSITQSGQTQNCIVLYPQIAAQAIQQGHASASRLHALVLYRARENQGRQIFSRADILTTCDVLGVMNPSQVDRDLRAGLGVFWTYSPLHKTYKLIGQAKIAAVLGVTGSPGWAVNLPLTAFRGRLADWKAAVYAAYLAQLRQTTPSRDCLCKVFGVSLPTLIDWERRTGVRATPRLVMVAPRDNFVADGDLAAAASVGLEIDQHRTARTWISIVGPRGRLIAGRRLMDNRNTPLPDYWDVQSEPGWEPGSQPYFTWQTTNNYYSPLDVTFTGRRQWLEGEIERVLTPVKNASGGTQTRSARRDKPRSDCRDTRPYWHENEYKAVKWQGRRDNRSRPAIVVKLGPGVIKGLWLPSHAALWGEI
jgi:hypothetical protein